MSANLVWSVRNGSDGMGIDMFHVYAPDMDTARARAARNLWDLNYPITAATGEFTVHAMRFWRTEPLDHTKLRHSTYPTLPDYPEGI